MEHEERLKPALADRYQIEREIGSGGMATVYLAQDLKHDRQVALKVLRPELAAVVGTERFLAEIRTTANLSHPHILPLFDSGVADGFLFYVMPYVEGESLRSRINRERQLPVNEAVSIAAAVASALDYAHRHEVVHRDIKPENLLLHDGEPMVADFGIALAISAAGGGRLTETGLSLGTPHYMSPEQASADRELDGRTDIYSLGATLHEMLAGEPPFTAPSAQAVVAKILTEEPGLVTAERPSVPMHVSAAIKKALAKLPADRFGSAAHFANALADPGFTLPGTPPPQAVAVPGAGRRGLWNPLSMVLAAVTVLLAAVLVWEWMGRPPEGAPTPLRLDLDFGGIVPDLRSDVIVAPDGFTFAVAGFLDGQTALFLRRADQDRFQIVPGTDNAHYPAFSPDGEWIVFASGSALLKVPVEGGAPMTVLPDGLVNIVLFPHWGDDETIVFQASAGASGGLYRILETGGEPELLLDDAPGALFPRLLPGGKGVLFTDTRSGSVNLLDLEAGTLRVLVAEGVDATYVETGHILYANPNGGLFAVPFDLETLRITGQPSPVLDAVGFYGGSPGSPLRALYSTSSTGTLVYRLGGQPAAEPQGRRLVIARFTGDTVTVPLASRDFRSPRWSPDGRSIAFASSQGGGFNLFTFDVDLGTTPRQLTFEGVNSDPAWSPDGTRLAFTSFRDGTDGYDVFLKAVGDDTPAESFLSGPRQYYVRHWPLEEFLVFEAGVGSVTDLWMADPSAPGEAKPYLESEADLDDIVLSPDGRWAAYQSNETGVEEVYARRFPEPRQRIPISEGGGQFPRWAPDGRTIYYWRAEGAAVDTLMAARIQTEPTLTVLSRETVLVGSYDAEYWDLHPDGDRIVAAQPVNLDQVTGEGEPARYLVVVNWFQELRERIGR